MKITMNVSERLPEPDAHTEIEEIEVTPEMLEAGVKACLPFVGVDTFDDLLAEGVAEAYRTMFAARPRYPRAS